MSKIRILHVDDEADIREVVAIAMSFDPDLETQSCASGRAAIAVAKAWMPDLILLDVMMPIMDGPATLARLRECLTTSGIPVVFMTARAQSCELQMFKSLGAAGVIRKPFDPMTLAASVRSHLNGGAARIGAMRHEFMDRLAVDLIKLSEHWLAAQTSPPASQPLSAMKSVAHGLAGAGGVFGFDEISHAAAKLESAILEEQSGSGSLSGVADAFRGLQSLRGEILEFGKHHGVGV